jgi:hypothetical protein
MKVTVKINDGLWARLKKEAARQKCMMSEIAENAIRQMLATQKPPAKAAKHPSFDMGKELVDIADREALYDAMEKDDKKLY